MGAEGSPETAGGDGGGAGRGRATGGEEALQFGLVSVESALAQEPGGLPWLWLQRWLVTEDPVAVDR